MSAGSASATLCWTAYVMALLAAIFVHPVLDELAPSMGFLWRGLVLTTVATAVVYLFSLWSSNSSVYDPYWAIAPLALGFYWKAHAPGGFLYFEPRETLGIVLLWVWAVRFFVLVPWDGWTRGITHEDCARASTRACEANAAVGPAGPMLRAQPGLTAAPSHRAPRALPAAGRYAQIRAGMPSEVAYWCFSFSSLHLTPTLLVYAALCPLGRVILLGDRAPPLSEVDALGVALTLAAIGIEAVADEQLRKHREARASGSCRTGLWRWSRHPNYCGECLFWTGLLVLASGSGVVASEPLLCAGAALMWAFFRFASVPLMDKRSLERRPDYRQVMESTSALLLWPPKDKYS